MNFRDGAVVARRVCERCQRAEKVCVCSLVTPIDNCVEIGILQHPSESKQVKGTTILAALSLKKAQLWQAELLEDVPDLQAWLAQPEPIYLLYPPTEETQQAPVPVSMLQRQSLDKVRVLVLDGTWRKTFKMMQLNAELQALPRVALAPQQPSAYRIRKQKDPHSLSTVEAIAELLSQLEQDQDKFQPLLSAFAKMQQQQLALRR